jgi:hypothetical protein
MTHTEIDEQIESIIDSIGLSDFFSRIASVASEKSDHVRTTWQDDTLAELWSKVGHDLDELSAKYFEGP